MLTSAQVLLRPAGLADHSNTVDQSQCRDEQADSPENANDKPVRARGGEHGKLHIANPTPSFPVCLRQSHGRPGRVAEDWRQSCRRAVPRLALRSSLRSAADCLDSGQRTM